VKLKVAVVVRGFDPLQLHLIIGDSPLEGPHFRVGGTRSGALPTPPRPGLGPRFGSGKPTSAPEMVHLR
jgi:hypothetical protein